MECAICLEDMWVVTGPADQPTALLEKSPLFQCATCHKSLHWSCVDESVCFTRKARCPMCRTPFAHPAATEEPAAETPQQWIEQTLNEIGYRGPIFYGPLPPEYMLDNEHL